MSKLLDSAQLARECFQGYRIRDRMFLDMVDETTPSANFGAAMEGQREPTVLAENCQKLLNRVVAAISRMERQGIQMERAACAKICKEVYDGHMEFGDVEIAHGASDCEQGIEARSTA